MSSPRMHVICSDLHPGCLTTLHGSSAEEVALAYAVHHLTCHEGDSVELDELLARICTEVLQSQPALADHQWHTRRAVAARG